MHLLARSSPLKTENRKPKNPKPPALQARQKVVHKAYSDMESARQKAEAARGKLEATQVSPSWGGGGLRLGWVGGWAGGSSNGRRAACRIFPIHPAAGPHETAALVFVCLCVWGVGVGEV